MSGPSIGRRALRAALVGVAFLPAVAPLLMIIRDGVDVPYYDEWEVGPPILEKAHQGTLGLADLFALHNEHRLLVTHLVVLAGGYLTHYNVKALMVVTFAIACATAMFIYWLGRQTRLSDVGVSGNWGPGSGIVGAFFVSFLTNLLLFSPVQYENWLWAMQLQFFMPSMCLVAGLLVAGSNCSVPARFLSGMGLSAVSTYSAANGMSLWALLLPSLLLTGPRATRKVKLRWTMLWLLAAVAVVAPYFYGYHKPSHHLSPYSVFKTPLEFVKYVLIYLGTPLTVVDHPARNVLLVASQTPAILVGSGLLLLFVVACLYCRHGRDRFLICALPWITLGIYAIATDVITGSARIGFGPLQAFSSRYTTVAICLIISIIHLVPMMCEDALQTWPLRKRSLGSMPVGEPLQKSPEKNSGERQFSDAPSHFLQGMQSQPERAGAFLLCSILGVALCFLHVVASAAALEMSRKERGHRMAAKTSLLLVRHLDDGMLVGLTSNEPDAVRLVRHGADVLQSLGDVRPGLIGSPRVAELLNSKSMQSADPGAEGALERVQRIPKDASVHAASNIETLTSNDDDARVASGWAVFSALHRPADSVILTYQVGNSEPMIFGVAPVGRDRPVATLAATDPSLLRREWSRIFPRNVLPNEAVKIQAWAFDAASARAYPLTGSATLGPVR